MNGVIRGEILQSDIAISDAELSARLSMKKSSTDPVISRVIEDIFRVAHVSFAASRVKIIEINEGQVTFEGFSVSSSALASYLSGSSETYIFAVTLGCEVDRLIMKKKALSLSDGFIYDAVASAIAEAACDAAETKIHPGIATKNRFSPGYSDCPLSAGRDILRLISADKLIGVKMLESLLMSPMKSVSAFIAVI